MLAALLESRMDAIRLGTGSAGPHPAERLVFLNHLTFVHQLIVASGPLLLDGIEGLRTRGSEFESELQQFFEAHWWDENQHAEWLAEDLQSAGVEVRERELSLDAVEIAGAQYYLIRHAHPCALLGYMARLEYFPPTLQDVEWLEQIHGAALLRTVRLHAVNDPAHGAALKTLIDRVPQKWQALVYNNGVRVAERLAAVTSTFGEGD